MNLTLFIPLLISIFTTGLCVPVANDDPLSPGTVTRIKRSGSFWCKLTCASPLAIFKVRFGILCWSFCPSDTYGGSSSSTASLPACSTAGHDELRAKRYVTRNFLNRHVMVHPTGNPTQTEVQNFINRLDTRTQATHTIIVTNNLNAAMNTINQRLPQNDNANAGWVLNGNAPMERNDMWFQDQGFANVINVRLRFNQHGATISNMDRGSGRIRLGVCVRDSDATRPADRYTVNHLEAVQIVNTCDLPTSSNISHCSK